LLENKSWTYYKTMSCLEVFYWKNAVNSEIKSIINNHIWKPMYLLPESKPLGHKWIIKRKIKVDGTIDKYKAKVVIKSFRQQEYMLYFDIYSLMLRITSIWNINSY
jgi:hypothetical protein